MNSALSLSRSLLLLLILYTLFCFSCTQQGPVKLTHEDSLSIYNEMAKLQKQDTFYFGSPSTPEDQKSVSKRLQLFSTPIPPDSAWTLVNNYKNSPIKEFKVFNPTQQTTVNLVAFEIDSKIKNVLSDPNVSGLRVYLGKRGEDGFYTLVFIPKDTSGNNYFSSTSPTTTTAVSPFDWNLPCPYNCPPGTSGQAFGDNGTPKPSGAISVTKH